MGECDVFVSHSWSDDASAKWDILQRWRKEFIEDVGREPTIWFDKACINQTSIDADLRCLPVFLSGCRSLVVLCGVSYLSRLWCIMELFTFVHMGGRPADVYFLPVLRAGCEEQDRALIDTESKHFDARDSTCYLKQDKQRLLSIIHAAYSDMTIFNEAVQEIFAQVGWWDTGKNLFSDVFDESSAQSDSNSGGSP